MPDPLTDASPASLVLAIEANQRAVALSWARLLDAEVYAEPEQSRFLSGFHYHLFNGVIRTQFPSEQTDALIEQTIRHFAQCGLPFAWLISPSDQPGDLARRLEAQGMRLDADGPGMAIDLWTLPEELSVPAGLRIEEVTTGELLITWLHTLARSNDFPTAIVDSFLQIYVKRGFVNSPSVRYYLALLDGEPVAVSQLFLSNGVAGVYNVGTIPQVRRRGIGAAITLVPLRVAHALGYRFGVLQASQMGLPVYQRLGFRGYCRFQLYFSPEA